MDSTSPKDVTDGIPIAACTVPLLLHPSYGRSRSSIHDELRNFRMSLKWCALDHSSLSDKIVSYGAFVLFAVVIPVGTSLSSSSAPAFGSVTYNQLVQLSESVLAAVAFLTLASFFRRHGLRQLVLLEDLQDDHPCVRRTYARELDRAFRCLAYIILPAFSVELAHKVLLFATVSVRDPRLRPAIMAASLASWVYRTGVFLLVCVLFKVTCELQILRFEGFHRMFDGDGDVCLMFREHLRIKQQLLVTSHRYRGFIIGCLVTISVSQLGALMHMLGSKTRNTFRNSGDIVVCSVVQLSGFLLCLLGAARITHRAQRVVSKASRWHIDLCCTTTKKSDLSGHNEQGPTTHQHDCSSEHTTSEECLIPPPQGAPSTFDSRQALVTYLQYNGGGITLFGFALDRGLLQALFAFETTLVLWILSKVVTVS